MNSIVALIPARGGSKGVPKKNIKLLNGKPLIEYTINSSMNSQLIDRTIITTDDEDIAKLSAKLGAEVPFLRPNKLAGDLVLDFPVIKHALDYLIQAEKSKPDIIVYLRPTMPTRTSHEIDEVVRMLLLKRETNCVRTTRPVPYPPYWMKKINTSGYLEPFDESVSPFADKRRQDLPKVVLCDGYVDVARVESVLRENTFPPNNTLAFYREHVPFIDIDTHEDWDYCEYFMKKYNITGCTEYET
jgi:CMP-N,N'-diacetyllegionaminic acid synthase